MTNVTDLIEEAATRDAVAAARASGVVVRDLTELADLAAVYRLYDEIWRPDPTNPPVTTELLRALTKAGNYVSGAYDGTRLVGACVGFFGAPAGSTLHSHIAGVSATGRSIGFALKLHQRAWALRRGLESISWTFDPLVGRNAYFNLVKLAARAVDYLPNFYGGMHDSINGGDESDRLLVHWDLAGPDVQAAAAGTPRVCVPTDAVVALDRAPDGRPALGSLDAPVLKVAVPGDIELLRRHDPRVAGQWRTAVREVLGTLLAHGARIDGYNRAGWYAVSRKDS
jgi:predicted GNAT superfamily acetyltransferase